MKVLSGLARALSFALAVSFSLRAQAAPQPTRLLGPGSLQEIEPSLLLQSTVIKVQQVWAKDSLQIQSAQNLKAEWLPEGGSLLRSAHLPPGPLDVEIKGGQLQVSSRGKRVLTSKLELTGLGMTVEGQSWPRRVDLVPGKGQLWVIYHMNLESYVAKVLPHEMSLSWPEEALKAQAIAIRTYASFQMERNKQNAFHVHSTTKDQVFKLEAVPSAWKGKLEKIMSATKGKILKDSSGRVASIFYHADCGGAAEQSPWVWSDHSPSGPPIRCAPHPSLSWRLEVADKDLVEKLSRGHREIQGPLDGVRPVKRSQSGRIEELSILMESGLALNIRPEELRKALGPNRLKSARFTVRSMDDKLEFLGHGYGHGVGLCQRGSKAWAEQGKPSSEILKIYYPNLSVASLHSEASSSTWAAR